MTTCTFKHNPVNALNIESQIIIRRQDFRKIKFHKKKTITCLVHVSMVDRKASWLNVLPRIVYPIAVIVIEYASAPNQRYLSGSTHKNEAKGSEKNET
jgi:hypothetical protein